MGGTESKPSQINSYYIFVNNKNLKNSIENFWKVDSYDTTIDDNPSLLPQNEKKGPRYLRKSSNKN